MEEKIIKCIMLDQDCFRDVRMLAAEHTQNEWKNKYLKGLIKISKEDFMSYKENYHYRNKEIIFDVSKTDREMLNKLRVNNVVFLGSMLDGLYLEKGFPVFDHAKFEVNSTDLDILIEYEGVEILDCSAVDCKMETHLHLEETPNLGYFKLRICCPNVIYERQPVYLKATKLKHKLSADLEASNCVYTSHQPFETFTGASLDGVMDDQLGIIALDLVAALKMKQWPQVARSFCSRPRLFGWPREYLLKAITDKGCGFVAKAFQGSEHIDYQWRISFASSEKMLVRSLSDHQIRAYLFFKMIFRQNLEESNRLSSYMMKNVLFWTVEGTEQSYWQENSIFNCVVKLIDTLYISLETGTLNSYFLPSLNLISHFGHESVNSLAEKVHKIRRNAFSVILRCTESPKFKGICEVSPSNLLKYSRQEIGIKSS